MKTKLLAFGVFAMLILAINFCKTENLAPYAVITINPQTGEENTEFTCDASSSLDPEEGPLSFRWDFETDDSFDTQFSSVAQIVHVFGKAGTFIVTLEVKDDKGQVKSNSKNVVVNKSNLSPGVPVIIFPANLALDVPINPELKWTCTDADGDKLTFDVHFGILPAPEIVGTTSEYVFNPGNLEYATQYYWMIVASDSKGGVTEGPVSSFKTEKQKNLPIVVTADITAITQSTATGGGIVISGGGESITARGTCWSISQSPTIANSKTIDGTGIGVFFSQIEGLSKNTSYYVRAYASNIWGTDYGNEVSFTTLPDVTAVYHVLYVPGSYQGWDPSKTSTVIASVKNDRTYEGYIYFADASTQFKFTEGPNWDVNYGDDGADGTLDRNGADIVAADPGYYKLNVYLNALTYTKLKTDWGVIGTAATGGWDRDQNMTFNPATGWWTVTLDLKAGDLKFRANDNWDMNYGDDGFDGILEQNGADIPIVEAGNYTLKLDLTWPIYRYKIKKN